MRMQFWRLSLVLAASWMAGVLPVEAATVVSYVASDDPNLNPDANAGTVDVWTRTLTDVGGGGAGSFLDGTLGWTIWTSPFGGNPATATDASRIDHTFAGGPLNVGQTVSIDWANSQILAARSVGVSLTSGGTPVVTVKFIGGDSVYRYDDAGGVDQSTGQAYQSKTLAPLVVTLTSPTTYSASFNGAPWSGTNLGPIDGIRVFNDRAGDGSDVYSNNLAIVPEPTALALAALAGLGFVQRRRRTSR